MEEKQAPLTDRLIARLRDNPIFAAIVVLGVAFSAVQAVKNPLQEWLFPASAKQPSRNEVVELARNDRDKIIVPVQNALRENRAIYERLKTPLYALDGWGIQESYYFRVREFGPEKNEGMKGLIDTLVANNTKVLSLLDSYVGRSQTRLLKEQENLFREHASLYAARWLGMKQAAISGEDILTAEPPFPTEFTAAIDAEHKALERLIAAE